MTVNNMKKIIFNKKLLYIIINKNETCYILSDNLFLVNINIYRYIGIFYIALSNIS